MVHSENVEGALRDIKNNGFCILRDVFGESELKTKRRIVGEIANYQRDGRVDPFTAHDQYLLPHSESGIIGDVYQKYPEFRNMAENNSIINILKRFLGANICTSSNYIIYKPEK